MTRPQKIFGIGLNYRAHGAEAGMELPESPLVFTKFPSALCGPTSDIRLPSGRTDWEVELVVVIGTSGSNISADTAMDHVAGYSVGQDISERRVQLSGKPPQFNLGKSFDTFAPVSPMVTLDAFDAPHDLEIWCEVAGERMQQGRTSDLIFDVPTLVSYLSSICTLQPGDLIFTGTPDGVGAARKPPRYLQDGEEIVSCIEGIPQMRNRCVKVPSNFD